MTKLGLESDKNIALVIDLSKQCWEDYPLLGDLTAAQAILEAGLQRPAPSQLALRHCNLFGMKPGLIKSGTAGVITLPTHEWINGEETVINSQFLSNNDIEDSLRQHRFLFENLERYDNLFHADTFENIARLVQQDGYATQPDYAELLIDLYRKYLG